MTTQALLYQHDRHSSRPLYRVTPSAVERFAQCPYASAHSPKLEKSPALEQGSLLHVLIAGYLGDHLRLGLWREARSYLQPVFPFGRFASSLEADGVFQRALESLHGVKHFITTQGITVEAVEMPLATPAQPVATCPEIAICLFGRLDCVGTRADGTVVAADWKTGTRIPSPDTLASQPAAAVYHLLAARRYPNAHAIEIAHVLPQTRATSIVRVEQAAIDAAKDIVRGMVIAQHTRVFTPTPGAQCGWCPLLLTCPAHAHTEGEQHQLF